MRKFNFFLILSLLFAFICLSINPVESSTSEGYRLIVKFSPDYVYDAENGALFLSSQKSFGSEEKYLLENYEFTPLMRFSQEERQWMRTGLYPPPRGKNAFNIYKFRGMMYLVGAEKLTLNELGSIAAELEMLHFVEYTTIESAVPPPPPSNTPDFSNLQDYRKANTGGNVIGLDIDFAWSIGIKGQGVGIADIEWGFNYNHEDLMRESFIELLETTNHDYDDHGTAVTGVMYAIENGYGMTGMVNEADVFYGISEIPYGRVYGIALGIENLNPGDVFLYEMQTGGQNDNYVPADFNMAVWDITQAASNAGIIVVAAAGNGSEDLDHPFYHEYNSRGDNGSIIVGAGTRVGRNRASFSTYGSRINLQGWGDWSVVTTGYGDLYFGGPDVTYTGSFSGTSSATPIVASAVVAVQSYAKNELGITLTPHEMRSLLIESGTPQGSGWGAFNIVPQPNVRDAITLLHGLHTGVAMPAALSVSDYDYNHVDLSWEKNSINHDVMLVWSSDNIFGKPEEGITYEPGHVIDGGGMVLYAGNDTIYQHTNLEPLTMYYYRAFSFNDSLKYSLGRDTQVKTLCEPIVALPFSEGFNANTLVPSCWEVYDHIGNGQVWKFGTQGFGLEGTTGNYAYLASILYGAGNSQNTDLVSPVLDLSDLVIVNLSFTHYFRQRQANSTAGLYYSIDKGSTWTLIQQWTTTIANPSTFNQDIAELSGQSGVRFKWNYTGTHGFLWNIDDIEITGISLPEQPSEISGPVAPCIGSLQTYSVVKVSQVNYSWEFPADWVITAGGETHSITVVVGSESGEIKIVPNNLAGSGLPRSMEVGVNDIPVLSEIIGPVHPCAGDTITYMVDALPDVACYWTFPPEWQLLSDPGAFEITVIAGFENGTITVAAFNECGMSPAVELEIFPGIPPSLNSVSGPETVCENSLQAYFVDYIADAVYAWHFPDGWEIQSGLETHYVNVLTGLESGTITVTAKLNCDPSEPVLLDVVVIPQPLQPEIILLENVLISDAASGNQWYNQDGMINGATQQEYIPVENGNYYVVATVNECSSEPSNTIIILNAGITRPTEFRNLAIYPIPFSDKLVLEFKNNHKPGSFIFYNAAGIHMLSGHFTEKTIIDTGHLPSGVYTIRFETGQSMEFRKVIRE